MSVTITVNGVAYDVPSSAADTNWAADQVLFEQALATQINTNITNVATNTAAIATIEAVSWTAPTLINSWANVAAGSQLAGHYKDATNRVWVRGALKSGASGTVGFVLPSGRRPTATENFPIVTFVGVGVATIDTSGNVTLTQLTGTIGTLASLNFSFSTVA